MKTGISTACFHLRAECEEAIEKIGGLGADCAEVFLGTFYEYRPEFSAAFLRNPPVEAYSVHTLSSNFEPQLFSPSRRVRGDGFYWLDQVMRSAQIIGAKKYTFHGGIFGSGHGSVEHWAAYMPQITEFCARYGVELCLENVAWCTYNAPKIFKALKEACPDLKGVLDIKQARRSGYPVNMYIEDMSGAISHVHVSDMDENGKLCLPGRGIYDFGELIKRLKGAGFDGPLIIEVYGRDYGDFKELADSVEFLKETVYKIT